MAKDIIAKVNNFVYKNFSLDESSSVYLSNYKKLVEFLNKENIVLDDFVAGSIYESNELVSSMIKSVSKIKNFSFDYTLANLVSAHESENFSNSEETKLSKTDQDLVNAYLKEIGEISVFTPMEELECAKRVASGSEEAKDEMIRHNLKLVVSVVKRYSGNGYNILDLIQEGNLGLIKAVEKFDYTLGYKFSTYAIWWIRQSISRSIADKSRTIRIPVHVFNDFLKLRKIQTSYNMDYGRDATLSELASETGFDEDYINELSYMLDPVSLDAKIGPDNEEADSTLGDFVFDTKFDDDVFTNGIFYEEFRNALENANLTDKELSVIKKRFGIGLDRRYNLAEVGKEMHVTRERVRQIESMALRKLRYNREIRQFNTRTM